MSIRTALHHVVLVPILFVAVLITLSAQDEVTPGPPPNIRTLIEAFVAGLNGTPEVWQATVEALFDEEFARRHSADEHRALYDRLRSRFGTVTVDRVRRDEPEAPLDLEVRGSTGDIGVITLGIVESTRPRISRIDIRIGSSGRGRESGGPPPPPIDGHMPAAVLESALDRYFSQLAAEDVFSGVALVAKGDTTVFQKAYGFADRANKVPNTPATRFNIGSINKTFTQLAVRQLVAQGKLALDDTLGRFFPHYAQALSRTATVQQLLNHRGGLADFFGPEFSQTSKDRFRSNADYFALVGSRPPLFAPGTRRQYCNGCYIALGAIVERVSGMPYERYVETHIFEPAGMGSTGYPRTDAIEPDIATGYTRRAGEEEGELRSNVFVHGAAGSAAGGGYSTAGDLLAFVKAVRAGRFPEAASGAMGIAGGAPGVSAGLESDDTWTVIVLTNLDPPTGERIATRIMEALNDRR